MSSLARECDVLCRHLIGWRPDNYVLTKYQAWHDQEHPRLARQTNGFDRGLVAVARLHPWTARLADAYSRLFRPHGLLRKKLILLLAILESCAPAHQHIDFLDSGSPPRMLIKGAFQIAGTCVALLAGVILFGPWQLFSRIRESLGSANEMRPNHPLT